MKWCSCIELSIFSVGSSRREEEEKKGKCRWVYYRIRYGMVRCLTFEWDSEGSEDTKKLNMKIRKECVVMFDVDVRWCDGIGNGVMEGTR